MGPIGRYTSDTRAQRQPAATVDAGEVGIKPSRLLQQLTLDRRQPSFRGARLDYGLTAAALVTCSAVHSASRVSCAADRRGEHPNTDRSPRRVTDRCRCIVEMPISDGLPARPRSSSSYPRPPSPAPPPPPRERARPPPREAAAAAAAPIAASAARPAAALGSCCSPSSAAPPRRRAAESRLS